MFQKWIGVVVSENGKEVYWMYIHVVPWDRKYTGNGAEGLSVGRGTGNWIGCVTEMEWECLL